MRLQEHNRQYETPRLENELVNLYFRVPHDGEPGEFFSVARAMQIVAGNISQKLNQVYLGRAFSDLGFTRVKSRGIRGYIAVLKSAEEMASTQRQMALETNEDVF